MENHYPDLNNADTLIVFDTNVWLDFYTYAPKATREICDALFRSKHKLWIPSQVFYEYTQAKERCRDVAVSRYKSLLQPHLTAIDKEHDLICSGLKKLASNGLIDAKLLSSELDESFKQLHGLLKNGISDLDKKYQEDAHIFSSDDLDPVYSIILTVQLKHPAQRFSSKELLSIFEEGHIRYKYGIGPGTTDADKEPLCNLPSNASLFHAARAKYGDLIIWKEVLRYVSGKSIQLIFVENERKNDWWADKKANIIAPVLLEEFAASSNKGTLTLLDFQSFIQHYQEDLGLIAGETPALVEQLSFREKVFDFVLQHKDELLESELRSQLDDEDIFYGLIKDLPIKLGYIEEVPEYDIDEVDVVESSVAHDAVSGLNAIDATVRLGCTAIVSAYISHDFSITEKYFFEIQFCTTTFFDIDYSDLTSDVGGAYVFNHISITNETLLSEKLIQSDVSDIDLLK